MTVEQRLFDENDQLIETVEIPPGGKFDMRLLRMDSLETPNEFYNIEVEVSCAPDDSRGNVVIDDLLDIPLGRTRRIPIVIENEQFGTIEWEHIPPTNGTNHNSPAPDTTL